MTAIFYLFFLSLFVSTQQAYSQSPALPPAASPSPSPAVSPSPTPAPITFQLHWVKGATIFRSENPLERNEIQKLLENGNTAQAETLRYLMRNIPISASVQKSFKNLLSNSWIDSIQFRFHYDDIDPIENKSDGKLWFVAIPNFKSNIAVPDQAPQIIQTKIWKNQKESQRDIELKLEAWADQMSQLQLRKEGASELMQSLPTRTESAPSRR